MSAVIGITFGNTSSSIAVAGGDGKVDVIANQDGDRSIPSVLSYVGDDEYHGQQAKAQLVRNPKNTIVNFRDYIGKSFDEIKVDANQDGANMVKTDDNKIGFEITRGDDKVEIVTVEEATRRHLKQLITSAEDYMGKKVEGVVITVPTDFSDKQRQELISIANSADIKILQSINEPSSALLAHLSSNPDEYLTDKVFVVADFGGVRSDAAVVAVRGGILTLLATLHDYELGGDKLVEALMEFFAKEFEKKYKVNPRTTKKSLSKLRTESQVVKKTLSNVQTSTCSIESLADGIDYFTSVNRLRYELAARATFTKMTEFVEKAISKAELSPLDIDEVLLVGGVSHTPKLAVNIQSLFPESTKISCTVFDSKVLNPDELVCRGAALQALLIESFDEEEIKESLQPVVVNTQHLTKPIGIKDEAGNFVPILVSETAYPIKKSLKVNNGESSEVLVELYEGKKTIKETVLEPPAKTESDEEDSDEDSDEEPDIKKEVVYECGDLLSSLSLKDLASNSDLEVIVNINQDGVLQFSSRELKAGSTAVKVEVGHN